MAPKTQINICWGLHLFLSDSHQGEGLCEREYHGLGKGRNYSDFPECSTTSFKWEEQGSGGEVVCFSPNSWYHPS